MRSRASGRSPRPEQASSHQSPAPRGAGLFRWGCWLLVVLLWRRWLRRARRDAKRSCNRFAGKALFDMFAQVWAVISRGRRWRWRNLGFVSHLSPSCPSSVFSRDRRSGPRGRHERRSHRIFSWLPRTTSRRYEILNSEDENKDNSENAQAESPIVQSLGDSR